MIGRGAHVFVDECKARGYIIAATFIGPTELEAARRELRHLLLKGQGRLHLTKESNAYRRSIISAMCDFGFSVTMYVSDASSDKVGREQCLQSLLTDVIDLSVCRLVLEQDDSLVRSDRQLIAQRLAKECAPIPDYLHLRSKSEPLLWVSDAAAWCWFRGGDWMRRIGPVIANVRNV